MCRLTIVVLILGLVFAVRDNEVQGATSKVPRFVPRRSPMLPQDTNPGLAMQSRAVDTRVQLSINEGEPEATLVGTIPVQQNFTYRFNEPPQEFTLDPESGQIRTSKVLDRESLPTDKFDLVVLSSQPTHPIEVRIHVLDVNDNNPEFPESSIAVSFSESASAGTKLLLDAATDKDTPENGVADDYFIVDGNTDGKFRLDVTGNPSGESSYLHLETTGKLDREQVEFYSLNVCARDRGKPPRLGYLVVNVTVLDVNDNPPIFQQSDYVVALNESVPVGTTVLTVKATDKDTDDNSKLTYYLPDSEGQFTIDPETGTIKTAEPLECPHQQSCSNLKPGGSCPKSCVITVFARDHGSPRQDGRTYVTVNLLDANDHDPEIKFSYFPATVGFATVDENAAKDSLVAAVGVVDNDEGLNGDTTVEIKAGNELGHFRLDSSHSFDIVRVNGRLDREEIPKYNLTIVATDKGTPPRSATAYLVIHVNDVNDHDPVFQQSEYSAVLSELSPVGSFVASISATDADSGLNARIYYDFDLGNEQSWFAIDQDTGLVTTVARLDREIQGSVELRVTARDGGPNPRYASTHLRVTVLDENDEAPRFTQTVVDVTLSENTPPHSLVATLAAIDNDQGTNGSIAYSLHPSVLRDYPKIFALDALTGQLTTKIPLDRETIAEYRVLVVAKDQGTPPQSSTATVLLSLDDVNDNAPVFYPRRYLMPIPEDTSPGTSIGKVKAIDIDARENARVKYSLESGGEGLFKVDERTGEIILQGSLRVAQKHLYELTISARDTGDREAAENAIVEVLRQEDLEHLDFDTYNGYEFKIPEDHGDCVADAPGSFIREVGSVMVTQFTSSKITYSIVFGDPDSNFKIDQHSGIITTAKCLDREEEAYYSLKIAARAGRARGITFVNITVLDVNDNPPKFPKGDKSDEIYLKENAAVGQEVYLARARDRDVGANARITYTLTHNPGGQFRVTENSGIIYLDKPIRSPPGTVLNVEVTAVDTGIQPLAAQHQIRVTIEDVNDHTPVFKLTSYETSLAESTPVNKRFFALDAYDADLGINGRILYSITDGNDQDRFGIFPDGQLYVKHVLDREEQDYYALEVTACDQGKPIRSSVVPVIVHIIDENDNAPQFTNSSFTFHIRENEPPETFVGKLLAIDRDVGRNADLTFSLPVSQQDFFVDPRNGFIKSLHVYDREELVTNTGTNYVSLEATVTDNGNNGNRLKDKVKVSIYVTDVNDNKPEFQRLPYRVQVSEGAAVGTQLLRVYTTDADEGLNGDVFYSFADGNHQGNFMIDEATGQISLARELDRETLDNYVLTVIANDAGLEVRLSSTAKVTIEILDENDNSPKFIDNESQISVIETTPINAELLKFKATDDDLDANSELTFAISAGNRRDTFYIDPLTGTLYLKKPLDYEEHESYTLNITCSDGGHPRMSSVTTLRVDVIDANDNPPAFPNTAIVRQIREGITVRTPVHSVTAEDRDSGDNGVVTYAILSQDPEDQRRHFGINPQTGVIYTLLPIDREEVDTFKLVVVATDQAYPQSARLSAEKLVIVIVEDLNDNAPIFISMSAVVLPPKSVLNTNLGKEIPVARLLARDLDSSTNGLVTYELMRSGPNYSDMFRLHRSSGLLTMRLPGSLKSLERSYRYQIGVRATDEAVQAERRSSETYVTLIVPGEDQDRPVWEHNGLIEGSVYENEPAGASIVKVSARAPRTTRSGVDIEYYVTNVTAGRGGAQVDRLFDIDIKSGLLQTSVPLDRETGVDWYEVEIYAVLIGSEHSSTCSIKVRVTVLDKNDVAPSWGPGPWRFEVSEEAPPNTIVTVLKAQDPDTIGNLRYSLITSPKISPNDYNYEDPYSPASDRGIEGQFRLDPINGQLRLVEALDRETREKYVLRVRADDGLQHTDINLVIQVTDTNDNAPVFQSMAYSFDVAENVPRGSRIGQVIATDADADGPNSQLSYALISDWANDVFSLNPNTGVFTLTASLDYEQVQHYILVVQATDGGLPALSTTVTVYCNVVDLNDNAPIFESGPHGADVLENTTTGTAVLSVAAQDLDSGDNGRVVYDIINGDDNGDFGIASNGTVFTRKLLDRETKSIYNLIIRAQDSPTLAVKPLSSTVQVTIVLLDVNDVAPAFISSNQTLIMENSPPNTVVMAIKAVDKDEGRNGYVEYSLKEPSLSFNLGAVDGLLRIAEPLDRERRQNYTLRISAKDRGEPPKSSEATITVLVLDENDNAPIFDPKQYSATVAENASIGASVLQVSATDRDEGANGRMRYSIALGDENRDFTISEDAGVIRVAKNLNFERKSRYRLTVKAEDCAPEIGEPSRDDTAEVTITVLDINDNAPVFLDSPYLAYVMENMVPPGGGFVIQVKAYDADTPPYNDQVRYFLKEGDTDLFRINASTGDIFLLRPLDREMIPDYTLTLVAMDTGSPPLTGSGVLKVIVLDVNDHSPEFSRPDYKATVTENNPGGTWVAKPTATDKDEGLNAKIRYSLLGEKTERFSVNPNTGEIVTLVSLDREQTAVYHLTLIAQDSSPTEPRAAAVNLTIYVADVNDNAPRFSSPRYTAYIPDSTKPGDFVFGAKAVDDDDGENSRIVYHLQGDDAHRFVIDSSNGVIRAAEDLSNSKATYQLQIRASDCGQESQSDTADLVIHLCDRQLFPSFKSSINTRFTLTEDMPEGRIITTLSATTPKVGAASNLVFAMAGGNVGDALRIDSSTGDVLVAVGFDYETAPTYEAWVEVRDSDNPPLRSVVQLLINVTDANDNPPMMEAVIYNATVLEEEYPPLYVTKITAKDLDSAENGLVTYYLVNDYDESFMIDENTGEISTNAKLDREEMNSYELIIEARDQGEPRLSGTATVIVSVLDKNDNPPRFTRLFSVNVTENAEIGAFVIRITSSDQDIGKNANVTYTFTENPGGKFAIDPITGIVEVVGTLDREEQDEYLLKVGAADGAWVAETTLTITIQDQNDNAPEFTEESYHFHFPELQRRLAHVGQVAAADRDKQGPNSVISYSLLHPSDLFNVDPATGDIFSKRTLRYKHTHRPSSPENLYSLTVIATDNGKPPLSSKTIVHVSVVDANNNAPKFEQRTYLSPVPEAYGIGKRVVKLTAHDDADFGVNAEIEYTVAGGNSSDFFGIEAKTGWIYIIKTIKDIPVGTTFLLAVRATDKGVPPQKDQVSLMLVVTGENRRAPTFAAVSYQVRVPENEPVNTTILTVSAVDGDDGPNGMIRYKISDSECRVFSIHPTTGAITILETLDYDTIQEYRLNITATDLGFQPKQAVATLTINVSDINDNPPTFNQTVYEAFLPENSRPTSFVYKVVARDIDSPKYAVIQYRIIGGSGKEHFQIQQDTGVITSRITFDYEEANKYTLDIVAANPDSNPQMVGFTTVVVQITGVNEFYPKFIQPVFLLDVSESAEVGTSVGLVQATDQDAGDDGRVYYLFVGSSNDRGFSIGSETGIISVSRHLDRETQNRAVLTVMAKNAGGIRGNDTDEAQVIISIQDGNDPPEFLQTTYEATVSEGAVQGTRILTVRAIDKDVRPQNNQFSYSIIGGNVGQAFKVDPQSGDVETAKLLDRESIANYQLIIGAIDAGSPPQTGTATVRIDLLDINDNGPVFDPPEIIGYVNENEPAGTSIMTLTAMDPDLPPNGAPFTYRLIGGRQADVVTLDKHSGVLRTTRSLDREVMPQLDLLIEVEDSGLPKMKSEHTVTVIVLDENDSPSTPRSVHIIVHSFNGKTPMGKIADVHPNDPDTTGDYTCKILQGSNPAGVLTVPIACDLHTSKITPGLGYSLSISGRDGRHPDVVSKVTVEFLVFSNATVENSVTLQINRITAAEFLAKFYRPLLDMLQNDVDTGDTFTIFSIGETDSNLDIYLAMETPQGFKAKAEVIDMLVRKREKIQKTLGGSGVTINYSPCEHMACDNGGSCSDQLVVYEDARITNSQSLILTSPRVTHEMICRCREGFTGARCERRQDPCSPNPCLERGQCRRVGYDFMCSCPANREGKLCELERGDACASNPCRNGGSCKVSPDGSSFFCLCRAGYRGNHCEAVTDSCRPNPCLHGGLCVGQKPGYRCSCPEGHYGRHCEQSTYGFDELSFMSFPALDSTTNDITIVFATTKPDALLLYNYGPQSGGRSDFIVLELINGRIAFSYGGARSAITLVKVEGGSRLDDGHWRKVTATRNGRVVSLSVSNCREHGDVCDECKPGDGSCYADDIGPTGTLNFNNNPLMIGGLASADPVLERPGQVHSDDLVGCVHSISINGRTLNLTSPLASRGIKNTCPRPENGVCDNSQSVCGSGKCYDKWHQASCQCDSLTAPNCRGALEPVNLSDGGYVEFKISEKHKRMQLLEYLYGGTTSWSRNKVTRRAAKEETNNLISLGVSPPKKMSLMFRTIKTDGILIYAATNKHYTSIELKNGQLSYTSLLGSAVNMTGAVEAGLADGRWHNLTIFAHSRGLQVIIDGQLTGDELDSAGVHDFLDPYLTVLFVGGVRRDLYYHDSYPVTFEGCIANFSINNELQPFNGSGSILKDVMYHGKVSRGCRGPIGISAAATADPLSIGITLVIVFFVTLLVAILVSFVVFRLRRQSKEKAPSVVNKNTNAIITGNGNSLVGSGNDGLMSRHENTYISDTSDLRGVGHMGPELISKKFKERELSTEHQRPQRPDIIEREVTKSPMIRDEHPPMPPPTQSSLHSHEHNPEPEMPEHYDLENASSIAPSDIDIVYHYKGYRDGMRKYKATPPPIGGYGSHHKHSGTSHRHAGAFPPRAMPPPSVGQPTTTPKLLQSTPLARLSPSSELSAQQPRILTLHDISGKPLQSALLATTSSSGGVGKDALNSNSERSLNSPIMSQLSGSTASRKVPQSANDTSNNVPTGPMGLTAEEIERLNSRPRTSSLVSTLDAVSSSSEARGPPPPHGPLHLHRRHTPPTERLERRNSSTTDESGNDSFTCSEIEYDNNSLVGDKRSDNLYSKQEDDEDQPTRTDGSPQSTKPPLPPNVSYDGFDSSFRGSLSTLVASDDDLSTHMGSLYRPTNNGSPSTNTALSWDYLLNWGPNFESLVGVFIDIAELPDSNRVPNTLRLPASIPKPSEEYV